MKPSSAFLSLLAALAVADDIVKSDVIDVVKSNFHSVVDKEDLMLLEFFAPWCGHCKALAPQYEEAATILKEQGIKLAKVDCVDQAELCQEHGIQGYPTLKVMRSGVPTPYNGPRKTDGIVSYMKKQSLPPVSNVVPTDLSSFTSSDKVVVVAFLSSSSPSFAEDKKAFESLANLHRDEYLFGQVVDSPSLATEEGANADEPSVVVYKVAHGEKDAVSYAKGIDSDALTSFLKEKSVPVFDEISPDNFAVYAEAGIPLAYVFADTNGDVEGLKKIKEEIRPVAQEFRGKLNLVYIDAVKFVDHAKSLNLLQTNWPSFAIQDISEGLKYPMSQSTTLSAKSVKDFVSDYLAGKIAPSIKSEPIPKVQEGPVHVMVADAFDDEVFGKGKDKDVLLEVYAPWCGHCKKLAPTYETLAEKYASVSDKLLISKLDGTTNDIPPSAGFKVQGFPTIKFKAAGSDHFIDYDGARDLADFVEFLSRHAKNDITPVPNATTDHKGEQIVFDGKVEGHDEL
ncbi:protein disulfide isomerase [Atractiella rhizophila]|nr:protein disulfide isomerase [Atractiella rhizophila]